MAALTKADIAEGLANQGFSRRDSQDMVDKFFELLFDVLGSGDMESLRLSSFGNFEMRDKTARPGRNPKTGHVVEVTPRRVVTFKASQKVKSRLEKSMAAQSASEAVMDPTGEDAG